MFAMIMTILCSTMLSVFMRMSEGKANGKMTILSANYLTCILLASCFTGVSDLFPAAKEGFPITLILGIITGVFYMLALVFNQKSITKNGVVLSSVFAKVGSLLVPIVVALCFYGASLPGIRALVRCWLCFPSSSSVITERKMPPLPLACWSFCCWWKAWLLPWAKYSMPMAPKRFLINTCFTPSAQPSSSAPWLPS